MSQLLHSVSESLRISPEFVLHKDKHKARQSNSKKVQSRYKARVLHHQKLKAEENMAIIPSTL